MKHFIIKTILGKEDSINVGVCIMDQWEADALMMQIARELNLAKSAFAVKNGRGTFDVKCFSSEGMIDPDAHAALATAHTLGSFYCRASDSFELHCLREKKKKVVYNVKRQPSETGFKYVVKSQNKTTSESGYAKVCFEGHYHNYSLQSYTSEVVRDLAYEAAEKLSDDERVAVERNHGKSTWKSFLTNRKGDEMRKYAESVKANLTSAVRFSTPVQLTLFRNCLMSKGGAPDMDQFNVPTCASESRLYCENYGEVPVPIVVYPGVPILPALVIAPRSPGELEVLLPPRDRARYEYIDGTIHIFPLNFPTVKRLLCCLISILVALRDYLSSWFCFWG